MSRNRSRVAFPPSPSRAEGVLRHLFGALLAAVVAATTVPAAAAPACYSPAEFEAEQAIRFHTELMVIGLTCQRLDPAQDAFDNYQKFTTRHRTALMEYESRLLSHFRRTGKGGGDKQFHAFRTEVANEVAQRAALMLPAAYCAAGQTVIRRAAALSTDEFRRSVADVSDAGLIFSRPPCDGARTAEGGKAAGKPTAKTASGKAAKPAARTVKTASVR